VPKVKKEFCEEITAPEKEYIHIENSGHDANTDILSMQLDILKAGAAKYIKKK